MQSDPLAESWQKRNHKKVIQNLKPKYPTPSALQKLATLAQVNDPKAFGEHVRQVILDAHLNHTALQTLAMPKVRSALRRVRQRAQVLSEVLQQMDVGTRGSANRAGMLLEWELNHPVPEDGLFLIPSYLKSDEFSSVFLRPSSFGDGRRPIAL
jgi:hypothetical protein